MRVAPVPVRLALKGHVDGISVDLTDSRRFLSKSQVLAVALRGNCRAPLIGNKTYGKAAVQGALLLPKTDHFHC